MALNSNALGTALYNRAKGFNDQDIQNIDQARQDFWKAVAEEIINHIKINANLNVPGTGLLAPNGAVSGLSTTGNIL